MEQAKAKLIGTSQLFQDFKNSGVDQKTKIESYLELIDNCVKIEQVFIRCENVLLTEMRANIDELIRLNGNKADLIAKNFIIDEFDESNHEEMIHGFKMQSTQLENRTQSFLGTKMEHWDALQCLMKDIMAEIEKERITPANLL